MAKHDPIVERIKALRMAINPEEGCMSMLDGNKFESLALAIIKEEGENDRTRLKNDELRIMADLYIGAENDADADYFANQIKQLRGDE